MRWRYTAPPDSGRAAAHSADGVRVNDSPCRGACHTRGDRDSAQDAAAQLPLAPPALRGLRHSALWRGAQSAVWCSLQQYTARSQRAQRSSFLAASSTSLRRCAPQLGSAHILPRARAAAQRSHAAACAQGSASWRRTAAPSASRSGAATLWSSCSPATSAATCSSAPARTAAAWVAAPSASSAAVAATNMASACTHVTHSAVACPGGASTEPC
jgi:hypothetical protein